MPLLRERIGRHVEPLEHVREYGQTLRAAGRIVVQVVANLGRRRLAPPELCHADGAQMMQVGVLQELRRTAVAGSGWGHGVRVLAEDVDKVALLALGVEHAISREEPTLQLVAHLLALALKRF